MITIRSPEDIVKARLPTHLATFIDKIFTSILQSIPDFNPEDDGHIILITPRDTDKDLCEKIGKRWSDNMFEGVSYNPEFNCYHAVILANNQFARTIIVPCEAWLDSAIKARMVQEVA